MPQQQLPRRRLLAFALILLGGLACDDAAFDNPCDPANLDKGGCVGDVDAATQVDMTRVDMRSVDMRLVDMTPVDMAPDMAPDMTLLVDMAARPDMAMPDAATPDMSPPSATDSVCTDGETSADCVRDDCTQTQCLPGPVCDSESGRCLPPGPGDCALQGCLNPDYCGPNGHCVERCETAGCPVGRRCDLNSSRCIPAGEACQNHQFNPACRNGNVNQFECEQAGGEWGVWVDRGDAECKCPAPDAGCPCARHTDCAGLCVAPADIERVCRAGTRTRCATADFPETCLCYANADEAGSLTMERAAQECPP